jgi:hypothetical protein
MGGRSEGETPPGLRDFDMPHEIERLLPRHYKIIELASEGHSRKDIAQVLQMTPEAIGQILNSPLVQNQLAEIRAKREKIRDENLARGVHKAQQILEDASAQAAQTHVELLGHEDARIRQVSANAILDRVLENKSNQNTVVVIEAEKLQVLQIALQESDSFRNPSVTTP